MDMMNKKYMCIDWNVKSMKIRPLNRKIMSQCIKFINLENTICHRLTSYSFVLNDNVLGTLYVFKCVNVTTFHMVVSTKTHKCAIPVLNIRLNLFLQAGNCWLP